MNMDELITKATEGTLLRQELEEVVKCLADGTCDSYDALLIIGRSGAVEYRELVERYLAASDDPMLARLALMILGHYWGLASEYKAEVEAFVRKVPWDPDDDVRLLAINVVGTLLAEQEDCHFIRMMTGLFRDEHERQIVREASYCALALAAGKSLLELPSAARHFDLVRDVDPDVMAYIADAERRCAEPEAG